MRVAWKMDDLTRTLIIDTSGRVGQVGVAAGDCVVAVRRLEESRRHARDLTSAVAAVLGARGWRARDVTAVIVGTGPGSFTGLRVGLTSAKALAYAVGCPLYGVPTFQGIIRQLPAEATRTVALADALQGKVYVEEFARTSDAGRWESVRPLAIRSFAEWRSEMGPGIWVTGPGAALYGGELEGAFPLAAAEDREPRAEGLLRSALEEPGRWRCDPALVEPIYLRGSSAEEKRKREEGG
jgi:tRNA threonylcarbamoyladenosine biosynthesis protein TsaB